MGSYSGEKKVKARTPLDWEKGAGGVAGIKHLQLLGYGFES